MAPRSMEAKKSNFQCSAVTKLRIVEAKLRSVEAKLHSSETKLCSVEAKLSSVESWKLPILASIKVSAPSFKKNYSVTEILR